MKIQILVDNPNSWIVPYAKDLLNTILQKGYSANLIHKHEDIETGDILILLSCEKVLKSLSLNKHNLVVHESQLPKGKGWSPLTWQILEGKNEIPITLFEADEKVDAGLVYLRDSIFFEGHELVDELRHQQGIKTVQLILSFLDQYPNVHGVPQEGESSFYAKRTPVNSEIDPQKTIEEQFNLLRVCDNEKYPAFFYRNGIKYLLKIEKEQ